MLPQKQVKTSIARDSLGSYKKTLQIIFALPTYLSGIFIITYVHVKEPIYRFSDTVK